MILEQYCRQNLKPDLADLYADWSWLLGDVQIAHVKAQSLFGDLFFADSTGALYFLDTLEGDLISINTEDEVFGSEKSLDYYLSISLAYLADQKGLHPKDDELLMFKVAPVLGGGMTADDIVVYSEKVAISLQGQLHRQIKNTPPGTEISDFRLG